MQIITCVKQTKAITTVHVDEVELKGAAVTTLDARAHNRVLQLGRDDHLEDVRQAATDGRIDAAQVHRQRRPITVLQQHKLVQRIVPLHQEDAGRQSAAQILVAVVRIPGDAALGAILGVRHLGGECKFSRHQSLRYLVHVQREAMRLFRVKRQQVMSIQLRTFARQTHQHILDDVQPRRPTRQYLIDDGVVQFVHVQVEDAFLGADE